MKPPIITAYRKSRIRFQWLPRRTETGEVALLEFVRETTRDGVVSIARLKPQAEWERV
jgi:hypothetical protein